jgi:hypothetical protein
VAATPRQVTPWSLALHSSAEGQQYDIASLSAAFIGIAEQQLPAVLATRELYTEPLVVPANRWLPALNSRISFARRVS